MKERFAADVTDAVRAQLLTLGGHDVQVLEFVETEHTSKNLLLRATRRPPRDNARAAEEYAALKRARNRPVPSGRSPTSCARGMSTRPFCADVSAAHDEPLGATASRVSHWLLVEYAGMWPHDPLDAAPFVGSVRRHLDEHRSVPQSRHAARSWPDDIAGPGAPAPSLARTSERGSRLVRAELPDIGGLVDLDLAGALGRRPVR